MRFYRLAIERGAPLAVKGFKSAAVISVVSILLVGVGLWSGTFPGLSIASVEERRLQAWVTEKIRFVEIQGAAASKSAGLVPVISSISADLSVKAECEKKTSCVSGRGRGGYGAVARALENLSARAKAIATQAQAGLKQRDVLLAQLAGLTARMQDMLADESKSIWDRRAGLRKIDAQVGQTLQNLGSAVPASMLSAYARELKTGIAVPGNDAAAAAINRLLSGYASSLEAVSENTGVSGAIDPSFPPRTGAYETFGYIGQYAPLALLTLAIELVFPIVLWGYTVLTLLWERYRNNPDDAPRPPSPSVFEELTSKPIDLPGPTPKKTRGPSVRNTVRKSISKAVDRPGNKPNGKDVS